MSLPLDGVKVLDLTRALSGPFCTMILADLGADVIKVEPLPSGDMIRQWGPFVDGESAYYLSCNHNKRAIAVDFRCEEGRNLIIELAFKSDIVVENFKPGTTQKMGIDYNSICAKNPSVIYASITGFGSTGPAAAWPGFDQIAQGYSGLMSLTGMPETGPTRVGVAIGDLTSGMWAAMAILGAHIEKINTGKGQKVETSLLASLVSLLSVQAQKYLSLDEVPKASGNVHPVISPYGVFETKDGPLNLAPATPDMWLKLCEILNITDIVGDARFKTNADRMENSLALKEIIELKLSSKTREEWTSIMLDAGIPAGPINSLNDVFNDPQVTHCGMVEEVEHKKLGVMKLLGLPIKMDGLESGSVRTAPPSFGQHTREVLINYGMSADRIDSLISGGVVFQDD